MRIFLDRAQLKEPDASWEIQAYEARCDVGGIWLPQQPGETKTYFNDSSVPPTPLYDSLTTNLPHPLMAFHDFPFPPGTPVFPHASVVLKYLQDYASYYGLRQFIEFNSEVKRATWDDQRSQWMVDVISSDPAVQNTIRYYDALIVANGHYGLPYTPPLPGAEEWKSSGRSIMHSIMYREPSIFRGKILLVVGGGPSGLDLVKDSVGLAKSVIHSTSSGSRVDETHVKRRARLVELRASDGAAIYSDGTIDSNIDTVVLATGYTLIFPFLPDVPQGTSPADTPLPEPLGCNGMSIQPLARHTFPLRTYSPRTLAFMGLPSRLAPLPAADIQAEAIATVFLQDTDSGPVWDQQLEETLVVDRYTAMAQALGGDTKLIARSWHKMFPGDRDIGDWDDYRASLLELGGSTRPDWAVQPWEREIYDAKVELRAEWETLEREGVRMKWVKDIGKGGAHEWVPLMYRMLDHARSRSSRHPSTSDNTVVEVAVSAL